MLIKKNYGHADDQFQENLGTPANQVAEKKEWYDYQLLNLIAKYVNKAKAEGKI